MKRLVNIILIVIFVLLTVIWSVTSQKYNYEDNLKAIDVANSLIRADIITNELLLKVHNGSVSHYDHFSLLEQEINKNLIHLHQEVLRFGNSEEISTYDSLKRLIDRKRQKIEIFKSYRAELKNSLNYLPQLVASAKAEGNGSIIDQLYKDILLLQNSPELILEDSLLLKVKSLGNNPTLSTNVEMKESLLVSNHMLKIITSRQKTEEFISDIMNAPTELLTNKVKASLISHYEKWDQGNRVITFLLCGLCGLFLFIVYRTQKKLIKGQQAMVSLNQKLSDEVEKQTEDLVTQNTHLQSVLSKNEELIRILAHDFRAPLNRIVGLAGILKHELGLSSQDNHDLVDRILQSTDQLKSLASNILIVEKDEANTEDSIQLKKVSVPSIINRSIDTFIEEAKSKDITIAVKLPDHEVEYSLDENYLLHILNNLISNAIKFSPKHKSVNVILTEEESKMRIAISDSGSGIPENEAKKLFGKFQTLSTKPTDGESSTGLGLYIVKKYVETLGGKVWYEKNEDDGSVFFIEFYNTEENVIHK